MTKLITACTMVLSVALVPAALVPQAGDDVKVAFEVGAPPAPPARILGPQLPLPDGAAMTFRQVRINVPDLIADMRAVDLNQDGLTDIVLLDKQNKCLKVYLGDATLTFAKRYKYGFSQAGGRILAVADFDGSGKPDVAVENVTTTKPVSIFFGRGDGRLIGSPLHLASGTAVFGGLRYGASADLDGNGRPDILIQDFTDQLFSFLNVGKKKFTAKNFKPGVGLGFAAADFDGDKKADCFIYDKWGHKIYFFKGLGDGTFLKRSGYGVEDSFTSCDLYAADLNRDRKMDLVGQGKGFGGSGRNWAFPGRGNGTLGARKLLPGLGTLASGVAIADLNGDGIPDLAAAETSGLWVYAGKGNGTFGPASILGEGLSFWTSESGAQGVGWGHFDGDRRPDLVGANPNGTFHNLVVFRGGLPPATLTLSNLAVTTFVHSTDRIAFAGSFDYAGANCVFKYLAGESHPGKSAYLTFGVKIDLPYGMPDIYVTYMVTGAFLEGLNPDAGTIVFTLDLPSPVSVSGFIPEVSLYSFRLVDFNLVRSNSLQ
jgi:hypothetical protein